ncbi:MAG: LacI family DNA-binding transcriptional regulator [Armatimonadota bacterium]|nr:LacI family DNA-binding transcriptional regulator [Armatimonadota bacterium]MDR7451978.1 LacI family DNA-binding transcriptional regulator [Armatimonadota bacterium]MDR7468371.1 LacI family DNA-binding transcriptional regulator [Armatimonadota bacterium]MDR7494278.1 LacI family DNA-binding transcriptional regulator [Armatimonadota bacterium]MDR7505509.1 LacI family DNA-binding transcriptional regulator [Armatimonadota bacterium]
MAATIRDVAARAGVSVATVSRVVNRSPHRVSAATQRRVLAAVRALGYESNPIARGLKKRSTRTVALIVPDISNPFFPAIARGIEDVARARGYAVLLCNTYEDLERERAYLELLARRMVDGLVFATVGSNTRHLRALRRQGRPVVLVARDVAGVRIDSVLVDNFRGEFEATTHLLGLGHRRIAHITGPPSLHVAAERRRGYLAALEAAGVPRSEALVVEGNFAADGGRRAVERLLARGAKFTAVVAANDLMAIGAMEALRRAGRRIPQDVAVVGFDDITFASLVCPALTTVAQPKYRMGQLAMERLLALMDGADEGGRQTVLIPQLVVRDSCGAHLAVGAADGRRESVRQGGGGG